MSDGVKWFERERPLRLEKPGLLHGMLTGFVISALLLALVFRELGLLALRVTRDLFWDLPNPIAYVVPVVLVLGFAVVHRYPLAILTSVAFNAVGLGMVTRELEWHWNNVPYEDLRWLPPGVAFGVAGIAALVGTCRRGANGAARAGAVASLLVTLGSVYLVHASHALCQEESLRWRGFGLELPRAALSAPDPREARQWTPRLLFERDGRIRAGEGHRLYDPASPDGDHDLTRTLDTWKHRAEGLPGAEPARLHVHARAPIESVLLVLEHARAAGLPTCFAVEGTRGKRAVAPLFRPRAETYRRLDLPFAEEGYDSRWADARLRFEPGTEWEAVLRRIEAALAEGAETVSLGVDAK